MIFEVVNKHMNRKMHCGVLEFTGPAGKVILPQWVSVVTGASLHCVGFSRSD